MLKRVHGQGAGQSGRGQRAPAGIARTYLEGGPLLAHSKGRV